MSRWITRITVKKTCLTLSLVAAAMAWTAAPAAFAHYDAFELPPGVEQTPIPRRFSSGVLSGSHVNPADLADIERLRGGIENYYKRGDYGGAEPLYARYVDLIGRVSPDSAQLAYAMQNYSDLLERLHRYTAADQLETKAQQLLAKQNLQVQPFALKQYKLGMTLDEFRQMAPPGITGKVKTVCSCDPGETIETVTDAEKIANVVQCGLWLTGPKDGVREAYKMTVANIPCRPDFKFVQDEKGYRLFEISLTFFASEYDAMKKALYAKYGDPKDILLDKMRLEMGNNFQVSNLIWDNGVSKIRLTNAAGTNVGLAKLRFVHRQLFLAYAKRLFDEKQSPVRRAEKDL